MTIEAAQQFAEIMDKMLRQGGIEAALKSIDALIAIRDTVRQVQDNATKAVK